MKGVVLCFIPRHVRYAEQMTTESPQPSLRQAQCFACGHLLPLGEGRNEGILHQHDNHSFLHEILSRRWRLYGVCRAVWSRDSKYQIN